MTTLTLDSLAIAPLSDLSDVLLLGYEAESSSDSAPVQVRSYANGVRRVVSRPGVDVDVTFAVPYITRSEFQSLLDLVGQSVCVRDTRQRRVFGVLGAVSGSEHVVDLVSVSFTVTRITYSEAV